LREGPLPDADDAIRDRDARQAEALTDGVVRDTGNAIRNRDARKVVAVS
jgi:hypothetical protein